MPYILTRITVKDYDEYMRVFQDNAALRQSNGPRSVRLFRSTDDPQELVLLLEWEDLEKAAQFRQSNELRERQQRAGVVSQPVRYEEVEHFSA